MRVVGVDPSSSSTGFCHVVDGELVAKAVWKPSARVTRAAALVDYMDSFDAWLTQLEVNLGGCTIDLGVVEELSVTRGHKTVRALSHFEAATYIVLERRKIPIMQIKAGKARNVVLGIPITSTKEEALTAVRMQFPAIRWSPVNQGGPDEADAMVLALASSKVLREQG